MTKDELNKLIAQYIIGIGPKGLPNSHLWMLIDQNMSNLDRHQAIVGALVAASLVKEQFHFLTLTEKGLEMNAKLEAIYMPELAKKPVTT